MNRVSVEIGVGGRFHSDQMAKAFLSEGFSVKLVTSYPRSRFPEIPRKCLSTFIPAELAYRGLRRLGWERLGEQAKMRLFGGYLALHTPQRERDIPHMLFVWSSFALERFRQDRISHKVLVRDSTHILHQANVLVEEGGRLGIPYQPDPVCINRELEEYELADSIIVLSEFAKQTFVERGISDSKITVLPLGVNTGLFKPVPKERYSGPLKAVYFGTISVRKGIHHLLEATRDIPATALKLTLVGPIEPGFRPLFDRYRHFDYFPAMDHPQLARFVANQDLYCFPSLEDGFPNTLVQAMACGLVPITTARCGPAELITAGEEGFILRKGDAESIREVLAEAAQNPDRLLRMRQLAIDLSTRLPWSRYHSLLNRFVQEKTGAKTVEESARERLSPPPVTPEGRAIER